MYALLVLANVGLTTRQQFEAEGFVIMRGLLDVQEVETAREAVMGYIQRNGTRHAPMLMGHKFGGWFLGGFPGG